MFRKLQKKLTFFYSITCGIILAGILLVCFFYMKGAVESRNQALFSSLFLNLSNQFQSLSFFSDQWLAQMETNNRLIIHIEENGDPIFFPGAWDPATDRETLIQKRSGNRSPWKVCPAPAFLPEAPGRPLFSTSLEIPGIITAAWPFRQPRKQEKKLFLSFRILPRQKDRPFFRVCSLPGQGSWAFSSWLCKLEICRQDPGPPKGKQRKAGRIYRRCIP